MDTKLERKMMGDGDEAFVKTGFDSKKIYFHWEIENFNWLRKTESKFTNLQKLNLSTDLGNSELIKWTVYLNVSKKDDKEWIGIFQGLVDFTNLPLPCSFHVWIRKKSGTGFYKNYRTEKLWERAGDWGFPHFFEKDVDESQLPLLENGSLLIEGKITVMTPSERRVVVKSEREVAEENSACKLVQDLVTFLGKNSGPGVVKIVSSDGKEHYSNQVILSARSPVFSTMFNSEMKEKETNVLEISDSDSTAVAVMLAYIHTGKFLEEGLSTSDEIANVAYISEKYDLPELHQFCDKMMAKRWDKMRAQECLELAKKLKLNSALKEIEEYANKYLRMKM